MPKISVWMPVRNAEQTVHKAVLSTLRALPDDSELLVYDDASSDRTASILDSVGDRRLKLHQGHSPVGVAAGLKFLAERSDSRWIGRMDADDISLPWRFRYMRKSIRENDYAFSGVVHFGDKICPTSLVHLDGKSFDLTLVLENPFAHPSLVARRDALEEVGGYRDVIAEDYDLWLRLQSAGRKGCRVPLPTILYRNHPSQTTKKMEWRARALKEPKFQASYAHFIETKFQVEPVWLQGLIANNLRSPQQSAGWEKLQQLMHDQLVGVMPRQRRNLQRRLNAVR